LLCRVVKDAAAAGAECGKLAAPTLPRGFVPRFIR
jgi:hypothetical protein